MSGVRVASLAELRQRSAVDLVAPDHLRIQIQKELRKPGAFWGRHWAGKSGKNAARKDWQVAISNAIVAGLGLPRALTWLSPACGIGTATGQCSTRRRVTVQRLVPSVRNFLKDSDNLVYAEKPLYDALTQLGLLKDDADRWCERVRLPQAVSGDGTYWTRIEIQPPAEER